MRNRLIAPAFTLVLSLTGLAGLTGCNGTNAATAPDNDWIQHPEPSVPVTHDPAQPATPPETPNLSDPPAPAPAPLITPSTVPQPSPSPTTTPTPVPSATPTPAPLYSGPAELEKYVNLFVDDAKAQGVNVLPDMKSPTLQIRIASLDAYGVYVIGLCETGSGLRRVTLDPDFWNNVSDTQRGLLLHHELGHCVLYRAHRSDLLSSGAYASIMYPIIMTSTTYLNNQAYYQQELFGQAMLDPAVLTERRTHICDLSDLSGH